MKEEEEMEDWYLLLLLLLFFPFLRPRTEIVQSHLRLRFSY